MTGGVLNSDTHPDALLVPLIWKRACKLFDFLSGLNERPRREMCLWVTGRSRKGNGCAFVDPAALLDLCREGDRIASHFLHICLDLYV